ncbi:hypothetical protein PAPYR_12178 [Paratrimastix pyriformis]|uniref:Uncharacterized protein n=1 Tax=Paratrimastix pyriformis TaxID=342808 RepID=A0ABQ8U2B2_9EUKA|nr:hypothetical protein PAPYR_12178 [Paratrimastix pyriformis]
MLARLAEDKGSTCPFFRGLTQRSFASFLFCTSRSWRENHHKKLPDAKPLGGPERPIDQEMMPCAAPRDPARPRLRRWCCKPRRGGFSPG